MRRENGSVVGVDNTPTTSVASGVWSLFEQARYQKEGVWPSPAPIGEPYFKNTTLLLHGDGTNGAQNNTFLDSSTNNFTITRNGNTTQGTFSPFSQDDGKWGAYFDGSGDYLSVAHNSALSVLGGSFTMECWFYLTSAQRDAGLISKHDGSGGYIIRLDTTFIRFFTSAATVDRTYSFSANTWYHVAVVSSGTTGTLYINGVAQGATFSTNGTNAASAVQIGRTNTTTNDFPGYITNVRITNTAVYTSAFTPPTTPLTAITNTSLLTCQSNRFKDNSANAFAITVNGNTSIQPFSPFAPSAAYSAATNGGSGYFDGSGDYLATASNDALSMGTDDFTVNMWVYPSVDTRGDALLDNSWDANTNAWQIYTNSSTGAVEVYNGNGGGSSIIISGGVLTTGVWTYLSVVKSGTTVTIYLNGVSTGSGTANVTFGRTAVNYVGSQTGSVNFFTGYISNVHVIKNSAVVPSGVPTSPATAVSGTSLLLNFTNAGILDNTGRNDLETVGNAQISTSVKKFGTGSLAFDGTGDGLAFIHKDYLNIGGGDFTAECWVYPAARNNATIFYKGPVTGPAYDYFLGWDGTTLTIIYGGSTTGTMTDTTTLNAWNHIALVRSGSTIRVYINGTQAFSATYTGTYASTSGGGIGYTPGLSNNYSFNGYIDDLRITKGVARYTGNFTPPTAAFEDQ